jgi:uncharacterized protein YceH (UPF0502 family)
MSHDSESPWTPPTLSALERRVLGVMVEKAKTTADAYPLSMNALVTGCNQKSNREPVVELSEIQVEDALVDCQKKGLVSKITGGRVERWRHTLYETWRVDKVELAILAELLLRGPQTEGELRGRASRMEPIDDLVALRTALKPMVERALVIYLTPEGRRGTVLTHGFHPAEELGSLRSFHGSRAEAAEAPPASLTPSPVATNELANLRAAVQELQARVDGLSAEVRQIKEGLGMNS